jgi:hypothetical protein
MTAEEIIGKLPLLQYWSPAIDGSFLTKEVDLGMLCNSKDMTGKPNWCKEIVMGHTMHDVSHYAAIIYNAEHTRVQSYKLHL